MKSAFYQGYEIKIDGKIIGKKGTELIPAKIRRRNGVGFDLRVKVYYQDGGKKNWRVHRLVWTVFNGTIPDGMQINHKDRDTTNNSLENLELVSQSENQRHWREDEKKKKRLQRKRS